MRGRRAAPQMTVNFTREERETVQAVAATLELPDGPFVRAVVLGALATGRAEELAARALANEPIRRRPLGVARESWVKDERLTPEGAGHFGGSAPAVWRYGVWLMIHDPELQVRGAYRKGGWRLYGPDAIAVPLAASRPESARMASDYIERHEAMKAAAKLDSPPLPE